MFVRRRRPERWVADLRGRRVSAVSAGDAFSAAILATPSDGNELWTWGRGEHGQLGLGPQVTEQPPTGDQAAAWEGRGYGFVVEENAEIVPKHDF